MRKILFKAKSMGNGKWIEGYYLYYDNEHIIIETTENGILYHKIDFNTLCQYTGVTDNNGNKIWENDIVHIGDENIRYIIEWHDNGFMGKAIRANNWIGLSYWKIPENMGNKFDNPELLSA